MDSVRPRGRKRYCCFYCNTYFYQVDSWQRHNRKHTGVEIECDDCGQMCCDHVELKAHKHVCEAQNIYADDVYLQASGEGPRSESSRQNSRSDNIGKTNSVHETPDSTSKQESIPDTETSGADKFLFNSSSTLRSEESIPEKNCETDSPGTEKESCANSDLDHLIGEDKGDSENRGEEEDPETEALIGIDEEEVNQMKNSEHDAKMKIEKINSDTQIVINVESALNAAKLSRDSETKEDGKHVTEVPPFVSHPAVGSSVVAQGISLDGSDMNKKYQPYFCKNCGARFTRKDSVTRHLKKGTCSGKSAIVCNICGKVFAEMFELQEHFKREHKNVVFTPTIIHRSILPRTENPENPAPYAPFPTHYIVHDQHMVHVTRPYHQPEQAYRHIPPGMQTMFYAGQPSFGPRPVHPPPTTHYHEQMVQPRPMELKFSPTGHVGKDMTYINNPGKLIPSHGDEISRKREHPEHHMRIERRDDYDIHKKGKYESDHMNKHYPHQSTSTMKYRIEKVRSHDSINLSEYTNNAMNSKQYYSNRFIKKEPSSGKDEPPRAHQCKVCGLEFPRFEYLLTHLRKHKEKNEVEPFDEGQKEALLQPAKPHEVETQVLQRHSPKIPALNDSNSSSSDDNNDNRKPSVAVSNYQNKALTIHSSSHEPMPIVIPQPHSHYQASPNEHHIAQDQIQIANQSLEGGPMEAITPGVDGKFRPFICENCGQRFTRKDSLVRHAKKQTCFEEATELKCKDCDKTFRYHKCLIQHQELIHGIVLDEPKHHTDEEDQSDSESEKNDTEEMQKFVREEDHKIRLQLDQENKRMLPKHDRYHPSYQPPVISRENQMQNQAMPAQQHISSTTPKIHPPKHEEKHTKQSDSSGKGNSQDSNYIGYCMLPRPFQCEYCGDRFAHRHSLKRHVRRHLGIGIPCHDCGKLYRDQSEWRRHQRSIHSRHYEKYEVPSRMSFREGMDQGLIGVVPNADIDNQLGNDEFSESENDDDLSMTKTPTSHDKSDSAVKMQSSQSPSNSSFASRLSNFGFHKTKPKSEDSVKKEEISLPTKEEKLKKPFDFKSHMSGDKDSRKSLLDMYLCSPNSDDGDLDKSNNNKTNI